MMEVDVPVDFWDQLQVDPELDALLARDNPALWKAVQAARLLGPRVGPTARELKPRSG